MDVGQQTKGDLIHENPPPLRLRSLTRMQTNASSGVCVQNRVDSSLVDAADLLLRADVALVRALIAIRLDYLGLVT